MDRKAIYSLLQRSSIDLGNAGKDKYYGHGIVNANTLTTLIRPDLSTSRQLENEVFTEDTVIEVRKSIKSTNVTIARGHTTYKAGQKIDINANFDVNPGASFDAVIK